MEHGLKDIAFYAQKHITPCIVVITSLLARDKPLEAPASVKRVYRGNRLDYLKRTSHLIKYVHNDPIQFRRCPTGVCCRLRLLLFLSNHKYHPKEVGSTWSLGLDELAYCTRQYVPGVMDAFHT